jgi:DNA-binding NarL/FixJ family response regulator
MDLNLNRATELTDEISLAVDDMWEILALIRAGRSAKKMAYELEVGVKTINEHVRKLCLMYHIPDGPQPQPGDRADR